MVITTMLTMMIMKFDLSFETSARKRPIVSRKLKSGRWLQNMMTMIVGDDDGDGDGDGDGDDDGDGDGEMVMKIKWERTCANGGQSLTLPI